MYEAVNKQKKLYVLPCVAEALDVKECLVRFRLGFLERPQYGAVGRLVDGAVHDHRHPHVGVRLQAERHDRHADEEHRDHGHHLCEYKEQLIRIIHCN